MHDEEAAEEGGGQAHGHPEGELQVEEDPEGGEHEDDAFHGVLAHHVDTRADFGGHVSRNGVVQSVGGGGFLFFENRHHFIIYSKGVGGFRLRDGDDGGGVAVEDGFRVFRIEALRDGGDVLQPQFGSGFGGDDDDVAEILRCLAAVVEPQLDVLHGRFQRARWKILILSA